MSKKFIPVLLILILGGLFIGYGVMGRGDRHKDDPREKYQKILRNVGIVLEQGHYNPKTIDDQFSQEVLKKYEESLDPDKYIFLQSDIDAFKKYENRIDDEIHGRAAMKFYPTAIGIFQQRIAQLKPLYQDILSKPFDFTKDIMYQPVSDSLDYPADEAAAKEAWYERLKYRTLVTYNDLLSQKAKAKAKAQARQTQSIKCSSISGEPSCVIVLSAISWTPWKGTESASS